MVVLIPPSHLQLSRDFATPFSFTCFLAFHGILIFLGASLSSRGASSATSSRRPTHSDTPPSSSLPALSSQGALPCSWLPDRPPPHRGDLHGARPFWRQAPPACHGRLQPFSSARAGLPCAASGNPSKSSSRASGTGRRSFGSDA